MSRFLKVLLLSATAAAAGCDDVPSAEELLRSAEAACERQGLVRPEECRRGAAALVPGLAGGGALDRLGDDLRTAARGAGVDRVLENLASAAEIPADLRERLEGLRGLSAEQMIKALEKEEARARVALSEALGKSGLVPPPGTPAPAATPPHIF